jgi:hypothetical protein
MLRIAKVFDRTVVLYNKRPSAVNQVLLHPNRVDANNFMSLVGEAAYRAH